MPARHKRYPGVELVALPEADHTGMPVEEALKQRRSVRNYSSKPMTLAQLSQLLFSAQGVTGSAGGLSLRTAPSAGALYPFEIYVVANRVEGLKRGIYHYVVGKHALELVKGGDQAGKLSEAGLGQETLRDAAVTFVLCGVFDRTRSKYGERGFRYVYIEAGHIAQNISLQAVSLGLGSVPVGAFFDAEVNELVGVDGLKEAAILLVPAGKL
ncbi:MAG: SagB/ThcOx family dehydrogenase [Candidatus Eiseniibacteriota bacterium]|nr:MAG: SagB/ThcOx family dehydrogenase [Candidatus Eisenbacteria bacterium]